MTTASIVLGRAAATFSASLLALSIGVTAVPGAALASTGDDAYAGSAITVKWAGGNDPEIQRYQPDHAALTSDGKGNDAGSGHWDDFKDLEVTVSKTKELSDESVVITAKGMGQTQIAPWGNDFTSFLQAFQCWGPDPSAPDFNETCEYGAYSDNSRADGSVSQYSQLFNQSAAVGTTLSRWAGQPIPFRAVTGQVSKPEQVGTGNTADGTARFFTRENSNELPFIPINARGEAQEPFTVQSAPTQPYLGCGDRARSSGDRCWLVVVPRGSHSNVPNGGDSFVCNSFGSGGYGQPVAASLGSPLSPKCTLWQDRVVVPLDFSDPYQTCPSDVAERRVVGSQLLSQAFSSWQGKLCGGNGARNLALTTNAPDLTRAQLLTGQVGLAAIAGKLTPENIGSTDPSLLTSADLVYAPLANTALVIGFLAEDGSSGERGTARTEIRLTPRLIAKLLTQSYFDDIPHQLGGPDEPSLSRDALKAAGNPFDVYQDPEWLALGNPSAFTNKMAAWLVWGPQGDDAIELLWRYVQSDADAVAFLRGEPDPWGMVLNPFYRYDPTGKQGYTVDLSRTPIASFIKADGTEAPSTPAALERTKGKFLDSTAYSPYSESLLANAARIGAADTKLKWTWNGNVGFGGDFVADEKAARMSVAGRFALGPTGLAAAAAYSLATASVALPSSVRTTKEDVATARSFAPPTADAVSTALRAAPVDPATGIASLDPKSTPAGGYPLAMTINGALNLTALDSAARSDYARLFDYAAGPGNAPGLSRGQLPEGYVPLSDSQVAVAKALAERLRQPDPHTAAAATPASGTPAASAAAPAPVAPAPPATQTGISTASAATAVTATAAAPAAMQSAVGVGLVVGAIGAVASGLLLHRRRT